jgi:hypothetical protein
MITCFVDVDIIISYAGVSGAGVGPGGGVGRSIQFQSMNARMFDNTHSAWQLWDSRADDRTAQTSILYPCEL